MLEQVGFLLGCLESTAFSFPKVRIFLWGKSSCLLWSGSVCSPRAKRWKRKMSEVVNLGFGSPGSVGLHDELPRRGLGDGFLSC